MTTKTKTTNEMIFATLTTTKKRTPKYADQLRELGYTVEPGFEYWKVNGLCVSRYSKLGIRLRCRYIEGKQNIAKIDFEDYFKKYDSRWAKRSWSFENESIADDGKIWQRKCYRVTTYYDHWDSKAREAVYYKHRYMFTEDSNRVIAEYKRLKKTADTGCTEYGWDSAESELNWVAKREEEVRKAEQKLEYAKAQLEKAKEDYLKAQKRRVDGFLELNDFLREHGVRR